MVFSGFSGWLCGSVTNREEYQKDVAPDTNDRHHPVAACRVCRLTLVQGGLAARSHAFRSPHRLLHARVLRRLIAR